MGIEDMKNVLNISIVSCQKSKKFITNRLEEIKKS